MFRPLWIVAALVPALIAGMTPARAADPVLVPIFDGRTLDGWTAHAKDAFVVKGGAIHFQPPNGGAWDYRPGHNNGGKGLFTKYPHPRWDIKKWAQCELLANGDTGIARMACCPLPDGATRCKAQE